MSLTQIKKAGLDEIALDHVFTIGASGSSAYTFQGEGLNGTVNNPTLYLTRGKTYRFENSTGAHPIRIQSTSGASGTAYNTGVTNNAGNGTVIVEVQHDAPDVLYYQCTSHAAMNGILYITGALSDGGVTTAKIANNAVTTAKINPLAVTNGKIADNAITTAKITDNAVNNSKLGNDSVTGSNIADNAVATEHITNGSVTAAKLASGVQTTINSNADNRVITGSGTANTLNGESNLTYDGSVLSVTGKFNPLVSIDNATTSVFTNNGTNGGNVLKLTSGGTGAGTKIFQVFKNNQVSETGVFLIDGSGKIGVGTDSPSNLLHLKGSGHDKLLLETTGTAHSVGVQMKHASGNAAEQTWQLQTNAGASTQRDLSVRDATAGTFIATFRKGGGITFNGDTAAANALDDYEEGTFTATYSVASGSITNLSQSGIYTKIGKIVHVMFSCSSNGSNSPSGQVTITGLPFSADVPSANGPRGGGGVVFAGYHAPPELSTCQFSGTTIHLRLNDNTTLQGNTSGSGFGYNAYQISGFGTYMTSA